MTTAAGSFRLFARRRQQPVPIPVPHRHRPRHQHHSRIPNRPYSSATESSPQKTHHAQSPSPHKSHTAPNAQQPSPRPVAPATQTTGSASPPTTKTIPGPGWFWLEPLGAPFKAYGRAQARRPYVTQLVSTLVIYFLGDYSAQSLTAVDEATGEKPPRDVGRTLRALTIGGLASIPGYRWFMWLGNSFNYSSKVLSLATKVVVNQVVFTPVFNTYFFSMQALLSGASLRETVERVKLAVPVSWVNSCKLWPAVTAFSFTFVAPEYRNIFAGVIAIGWQTYLSILNQRAAREEAMHHEKEHVHQPKLTHAQAHAQA